MISYYPFQKLQLCSATGLQEQWITFQRFITWSVRDEGHKLLSLLTAKWLSVQKWHPSYKHLKGYKKAHKYFIICCFVPDLGIFSVSPINDIQCTRSLAIWQELGIKMKIFRGASQLAVIAQQLSLLSTSARAALPPVRTVFLQQPHSQASFPNPFPPSFPNIQISSRGERCMLIGLFP